MKTMKKEMITLSVLSIVLGFIFLSQSCTKEVEVVKIETRADTVYSHSTDTLYKTDTITHLDTIIVNKPILRVDTVYKDKIVVRVDTVYKVLNQLALFRYGVRQVKDFDNVETENIQFSDLDQYDFVLIRYYDDALFVKMYMALDIKTGVYQIKERWNYYYWEDGSLNNINKTIIDPKFGLKFIIK